MRSSHRRNIRRKNDHNNGNGNDPPNLPPVVSSILPSIFPPNPTTPASVPTQTLGSGSGAGANPPAPAPAPPPAPPSPVPPPSGPAAPPSDPGPAPPPQPSSVGGGDVGGSPPPGGGASGGTPTGGNDLTPGSSPPSSADGNALFPSVTVLAGGETPSSFATDSASPSASSKGVAGSGSDGTNAAAEDSGPSNSTITQGSHHGDPNYFPNTVDGSNTATGSGSPGSSSATNNHHGLSPGSAFAVVFLSLLVTIGVVVLVLRRRNVNKRNQRKQRWFGSNGYGFLGFGSITNSEEATIGSETRSVRSSFGPSFDHGDFDDTAPEFPPMAEISPKINHAHVPTAMLVNTGTGSNRSSAQSTYTNDVDPQYAIAYAGEPYTSMVVSPFTPSESFIFPQPPSSPTSSNVDPDVSENGRLRLKMPKSSQATLKVLAKAVISGGPLPPVPPSPAYVPPRSNITDPFADPHEQVRQNPNGGVGGNAGFGETEMIRRPFAPTLGDELAVEFGDVVRMLQLYDDGWVLVQKGDKQGLIPVDCLREPGQDLATFVAARRISSYGVMEGIAS